MTHHNINICSRHCPRNKKNQRAQIRARVLAEDETALAVAFILSGHNTASA